MNHKTLSEQLEAHEEGRQHLDELEEHEAELASLRAEIARLKAENERLHAHNVLLAESSLDSPAFVLVLSLYGVERIAELKAENERLKEDLALEKRLYASVSAHEQTLTQMTDEQLEELCRVVTLERLSRQEKPDSAGVNETLKR